MEHFSSYHEMLWTDWHHVLRDDKHGWITWQSIYQFYVREIR